MQRKPKMLPGHPIQGMGSNAVTQVADPVIELGAVEYMRMLDCFGTDGIADKPILHVVSSWSAVTENGEPLFTVEEFGKLDRATQIAIGNVAMKLNWMQGDEKNVEAGQESDSPSGSL